MMLRLVNGISRTKTLLGLSSELLCDGALANKSKTLSGQQRILKKKANRKKSKELMACYKATQERIAMTTSIMVGPPSSLLCVHPL